MKADIKALHKLWQTLSYASAELAGVGAARVELEQNYKQCVQSHDDAKKALFTALGDSLSVGDRIILVDSDGDSAIITRLDDTKSGQCFNIEPDPDRALS